LHRELTEANVRGSTPCEDARWLSFMGHMVEEAAAAAENGLPCPGFMPFPGLEPFENIFDSIFKRTGAVEPSRQRNPYEQTSRQAPPPYFWRQTHYDRPDYEMRQESANRYTDLTYRGSNIGRSNERLPPRNGHRGGPQRGHYPPISHDSGQGRNHGMSYRPSLNSTMDGELTHSTTNSPAHPSEDDDLGSRYPASTEEEDRFQRTLNLRGGGQPKRP
jgi:hypothetical protein